MLIIIYFRFCVCIVYASIEIHDLNNNPIAIVPLGKAKLKIGHIRIIQPINYAQFIETIDNFDILIKKKAYNTQLYKLLKTKYNMLYQTYLKISPTRNRSKRWNTIGTIWKWIAGTPDADDLRIINNTMNSLIEENNQQVYINQAADARLQHISNITNELMELNFKTEQQHLVNINLLTILLNVDIIQHQIEVLEDAILLAKHSIPSSHILSIKDYLNMKIFLQKHSIIVTSFEDLLSKSIAQVTMNSTHIIYIY